MPPSTTPFSGLKKTCRRDGFTLTELMVVGVIFVILASLLFSTLSSIRKVSNNTRCIDNLRGLGGALAAYAADNGGAIPPRYLGYNRPVNTVASELRAWPSRLVNLGYITASDVFFCPSFTPRNLKAANRDVRKGYGIRTWAPPGIYGTRYAEFNEEEKKLLSIEDPSTFFLIADSYWNDWGTQGYGITPGNKVQQVHLRHNRRANALFADGHVEAKDKEYFETLHLPDKQGPYSSGAPGKNGAQVYATVAPEE